MAAVLSLLPFRCVRSTELCVLLLPSPPSPSLSLLSSFPPPDSFFLLLLCIRAALGYFVHSIALVVVTLGTSSVYVVPRLYATISSAGAGAGGNKEEEDIANLDPVDFSSLFPPLMLCLLLFLFGLFFCWKSFVSLPS